LIDLRAAHLNVTAMRRCLFIAVICGSALPIVADAQDGPKNAVVLIIRHAEDAGSGHGLSPRGEERAEAYKNYFLNFTVDSKRREPNAVLVAADSKQSHRPRLTVEPFAKAAKLPIDSRFANKQPTDLAAELRASHQGKVVLICWHHGQIPALLRALGAAPETLLPNGKWPKTVYDWVIMASFDENGRLISKSTRRISEHLLQGDSQ
jgi:broad specificity phosphatase PhoE